MDYSFVRMIGAGELPPARLQSLRYEAVPGSHADAILREALLDRDYELQGVRTRARALADAGEFLLTSFPDRVGPDCNVLVRSEFLLLREVGAGRLDSRAIDQYVSRTIRRLVDARPRAVIYRCLDYNPDELDCLPESMRVTADGDVHRSRGAQRLLDQPALLALDCRIVGGLASAGIAVEMLIPFVQFPAQAQAIRAAITSELPAPLARTTRIGMMLEVPVNLYQIAACAEVDFFVFGPSDLLRHFYGGLDRNTPMFAAASFEPLAAPLHDALRAIDDLGGKVVYFAKDLIDWAARQPGACAASTWRSLLMPSQLVSAQAASDLLSCRTSS